jgi:RNA polymerase sigma-32 factor
MERTSRHGKDEAVRTYEDQETSVPYDPLKKYLSDISKHSVLTKEEEVEIAEKAHRYKDLEASQKLVMSNLRLVVKIALDYYNTYLNILDLIQEGNVGLVQAVKKYNPYKGTRFSTYASFWIRAYIKKHIMDSRSIVKIGTTQGQRRLFYGLNREKRKLEAMGVTPAPQLLADTLRVKAEEVEDMDRRLSHGDISLEQHIYEEGEETFMSLISADENVEEAVAEKEKKEMIKEKIREFKKTLNEKALYILENRIMADEPRTLTEIGERFHISRERVRQIQNKVLKKFTVAFEAELQKLDFLVR